MGDRYHHSQPVDKLGRPVLVFRPAGSRGSPRADHRGSPRDGLGLSPHSPGRQRAFSHERQVREEDIYKSMPKVLHGSLRIKRRGPRPMMPLPKITTHYQPPHPEQYHQMRHQRSRSDMGALQRQLAHASMEDDEEDDDSFYDVPGYAPRERGSPRGSPRGASHMQAMGSPGTGPSAAHAAHAAHAAAHTRSVSMGGFHLSELRIPAQGAAIHKQHSAANLAPTSAPAAPQETVASKHRRAASWDPRNPFLANAYIAEVENEAARQRQVINKAQAELEFLDMMKKNIIQRNQYELYSPVASPRSAGEPVHSPAHDAYRGDVYLDGSSRHHRHPSFDGADDELFALAPEYGEYEGGGGYAGPAGGYDDRYVRAHAPDPVMMLKGDRLIPVAMERVRAPPVYGEPSPRFYHEREGSQDYAPVRFVAVAQPREMHPREIRSPTPVRMGGPGQPMQPHQFVPQQQMQQMQQPPQMQPPHMMQQQMPPPQIGGGGGFVYVPVEPELARANSISPDAAAFKQIGSPVSAFESIAMQ